MAKSTDKDALTDPFAEPPVDTTQDPDTPHDDTETIPDWYCPGCGQQYEYQRECTGRGEAPHPPIQVVSTAELSGDPANVTKAPDSV